MRPTVLLSLLVATTAVCCVDFGYDVPRVSMSADAAAGAAANADSGSFSQLDDGGGSGSAQPVADAAAGSMQPAADGGGAGTCVSGPVKPQSTGPQLAYITLTIDKPVLAVHVGDIVTWTNTDSMVHTVTAGAPGAKLPAAQGGFDSGKLPTGGKWAYRFCAAKTFVYFCTEHPKTQFGYRVIVK